MKLSGIKKKIVKIQNIPARLEEREEEFMDNILKLDDKINQI